MDTACTASKSFSRLVPKAKLLVSSSFVGSATQRQTTRGSQRHQSSTRASSLRLICKPLGRQRTRAGSALGLATAALRRSKGARARAVAAVALMVLAASSYRMRRGVKAQTTTTGMMSRTAATTIRMPVTTPVTTRLRIRWRPAQTAPMRTGPSCRRRQVALRWWRRPISGARWRRCPISGARL